MPQNQDSVEVSVDEKNKKVTIVLPLDKPRRSKSGKTMVIASTLGNLKTDAKFRDNPVTVGVNVYYKATDEDEGDADEAPKKKGKAKKEKEDEDEDDDD